MYPRFIQSRIETALCDTRVVMLSGPRQSGKTTLARTLSGGRRVYRTLDDATTLSAALEDPTGFVRDLDHVTIDEVQRAPGLLLAIKDSVDRDPRPGRFLLTGSANIMTLPKVSESLAGRMEAIRLMPLSQAELRSEEQPDFLGRAFGGAVPLSGSGPVGSELVEAVLAGGYPEALTRVSWSRRQAWYGSYVDAIVNRDVRDILAVEKLDRMPRLLRALAEHSGQLTNHTTVGAAIGLNHVTARSYTAVFEQLFLILTLSPWHNNALNRLTKTPKLHFLDAGLLAALRGLTPETVKRDRTRFGSVLETFVVCEVLKAADWRDERLTFSHYRDKDQNEVDLVIESPDGRVVGIEVKAGATVGRPDFSGLRKLAEATGDRFMQGLVLYDGDTPVPFGNRLWAAPISSLWTV